MIADRYNKLPRTYYTYSLRVRVHMLQYKTRVADDRETRETETESWPRRRIHGDSMILMAECIFSQSATGEVSSACFRKLAISRGGEGSVRG